MGVLWSSIGASFPYEEFVGLVEVAGGVLLFVPRTQLAGALVAFGAMFEVFMLNMTYDVPVKLFSFHLVVMSVVLIAPYAKPLGALVFRPGARSRWARGRADDRSAPISSAWPRTAAGRAGSGSLVPRSRRSTGSGRSAR